MITVIYEATAEHAHPSHHSGLLGSIERGFGWGLGREAAHLVFGLVPPGVVIVVALIALGCLAWRWSRGR